MIHFWHLSVLTYLFSVSFFFCSDDERIGTKRKKVRHIQNFFGDGGGAGFERGAGGNDGGDINKGTPHNLWIEGSEKKITNLWAHVECSTPLQEIYHLSI